MDTKILRSNQIAVAVELLARGEVLAMPTETVYGLAADATNDSACAAVFAIKKRPPDNPLIVHFASQHHLEQHQGKLSSLATDLLQAFAPGPITLVLPSASGISSLALAGQSNLAVRIPAHPVAQQLIAQLNRPLVAPSANLSGRYSATSCTMVLDQLRGLIPAIIDGGSCSLGIESTVVHLQPHHATILRYGSLSQLDIERVVGKNNLSIAAHLHHPASSQSSLPTSPGTRYAHYQPRTPLLLFESAGQLRSYLLKERLERCVILAPAGVVDKSLCNDTNSMIFSSASHYAQSLYGSLSRADALRSKMILAYYHSQLGDALCDRLLRAAAYQFVDAP
jgi:L-threonylcarbamoyladenylate synthase